MKRLVIVLLILCVWISTRAQEFEKGNWPRTVRTHNFWSDWFIQTGLDMSLQNPYGYNFAHVFPNGKTFGMDVAVGKWFTHQVGLRGKINWENKLPLLENKQANWVAPFDKPGVNREKGGYMGFYGDLLVNLHNLLGTYKPERIWNLSFYPRIGVNYNFGVSKGAILAGVGFLNTYRLNSHWSLYADLAYIMTGSGFVGGESKTDTGTGSNSNGYFSIGIGAQYYIGRSDKNSSSASQKCVETNGFWDNWFLQAGADMSLMNPYGCNFTEVFPKGKTFGVNVAMGKWFSPEFAVRARVNWENGLIENRHLEWVPPTDHPEKNYDGHGYGLLTLDYLVNISNAAVGYNPNKKWHTSAFLRAGLISQFEIGSASPIGGVGLEQTYRLNDKWSLFSSAAYQVTTSESSGGNGTGMKVSTGSNGFFDVNLGVVYNLGRCRFYNDSDEKSQAYALPVGKHNWSRFIVNTTVSVGVAFAAKTVLKKMVNEERPDHSNNKSFPSGHASMAFAAARSIDKEFRRESIWIPIAGYAAATAVGVERVVNDRHHWYDVVAGAGIGLASAELTWWLCDKLFKNDDVGIGITGNSIDVAMKL